jgi:hypothetical protein
MTIKAAVILSASITWGMKQIKKNLLIENNSQKGV